MGAVFRVPIETAPDGPPEGLPRVALVAGAGAAAVGCRPDRAGAAAGRRRARWGCPTELVESADHVARIPQATGAESLNAAAAATVALYEAVRQRA